MMERLERFCGRLGVAPWILFFVLSALLFLLGAASFASSGLGNAAQVGVLGAVLAVAVIAAFVRRG